MSRPICKPIIKPEKCIDCVDNKLPPAGSLTCPEGSYAGYPNHSDCPKGKCPIEECIKYGKKLKKYNPLFFTSRTRKLRPVFCSNTVQS